MKKIVLTLLCTATLIYGADVPGLKEVRNSPYLATSFAFFVGSTFRITRLISIPGAVLCGLALFNPEVLTNWKTHLSWGENATTLWENTKRIYHGTIHKAVKKSSDIATKLENENNPQEPPIEKSKTHEKKNRPKNE